MNNFFLVQIKRTNGSYDKGVVVKETLASAKQSYHAYLGAYAYGNHKETDYVQVQILDRQGLAVMLEVWEEVKDEA